MAKWPKHDMKSGGWKQSSKSVSRFFLCVFLFLWFLYGFYGFPVVLHGFLAVCQFFNIFVNGFPDVFDGCPFVFDFLFVHGSSVSMFRPRNHHLRRCLFSVLSYRLVRRALQSLPKMERKERKGKSRFFSCHRTQNKQT